MRTKLFALFAGFILVCPACIPTAHAQVDSWTNNVRGNFKWEDGSKWSLGVPPSFPSVSVFITNNPSAGSGSLGRTVNIDATTAASFSSTMDINSLTISSPSTINRNTVLVSNTGSTPLLIRQNLEVLSRCTLSITNATLEVENYSDVDGTLNITGGTVMMSKSSNGADALDIGVDPSALGTVLLTGGTLDTAYNNAFPNNIIYVNTVIGDGGAGQLSVSNATWLATQVFIGGGSQGTLTVADGGSATANILSVGSGGTGTVWLTGGQLDVMNNDPFSQLIIGNGGVGAMTISNGTCQSLLMVVGENSSGTLVLAGGMMTVSNNLFLGGGFATDTIWMTGGQLIVGSATVLGGSGVAQMTVSNGIWQSQYIGVGISFLGHEATLAVAGGTNSAYSELSIGASDCGTTGSVAVTGGGLFVTNAAHDAVMDLESGTLTLSGGILAMDAFVKTNPCATFQQTGGILIVGDATIGGGYADVGFGLPGSLSVANGGSVTSDLYAGGGSTGTVWLTGGQIDASAGLIILGAFGGGVGIMTVSNGTCQSYDTVVGQDSPGTLTLPGGLTTVSNEFFVGGLTATGTVWVTGGQLVVSFDTILGDAGVGQMTVSNGTWQSGFVEVGSGFGGRGALTVAGGTNSAYSGLSIGTPNCSGKGTVIVNGGSLFVTNAAHNAVLDLESGTLTLSGGTLAVDALVTNNPCGVFLHTGGTLIVGGITNLSSPLAFSITAISRSGNDMRITWQSPGGVTNVVQGTNGGPGGNYSTNFVDLSPQFILTGSGLVTTNYLDVGGATNTPSRYYRVRLVP